MNHMSEWFEIILRSLLYLITLLLMTRIIGKKQLSELSLFEYISGITIGSIAGEVIMGLDGNIFHGVLAIGIFGIATVLVDILTMKSKKMRELIDGNATVLIKDGKILEENLKKEKYTIDELTSLLRQKNVFKLADVEFAVLEPKGDLSVLLKRDKQPLTPKDIQLQVPPEKEPHTIIMDGKIIDEPLTASGKTRKWLNLELTKLGVTLDNVFLAQIDSYGELTIDIYNDKLNVPSPMQRPLLFAMMKKCQADLELFSLSTESQEAKKMYSRNAERLMECIKKIKPFLTS
ncbi:DUF421 domain-containing protein [Bacillus massilinigeriensis]|uniref:DUF421 domain-containing protein n=1 Tax=Bacillus massilionigeriensis TaxID=1805475 RepID=UPI00096B0CA1|nr:DUF421 domain-containing protein [Bacillus massilionigeriensis]